MRQLQDASTEIAESETLKRAKDASSEAGQKFKVVGEKIQEGAKAAGETTVGKITIQAAKVTGQGVSISKLMDPSSLKCLILWLDIESSSSHCPSCSTHRQ